MNIELEAQKAIFMKAYLQIQNKNILDRFEELLLEVQEEELEKALFAPITKADMDSDELTTAQHEKLLTAMQEVKERKVMTTEQLREKTNQWLTK